uniref:Tyrosine hydroxylase 2 n=1 Tax=Oncorhynchus mykiss TaxID=8022 RepID=A0A8C7TVH2_ONCMY
TCLSADGTDSKTAVPRRVSTESVVQNIPFVGRKPSLIEDARKERASCSSSPDPSRGGENVVFKEKEGTVTLNILFALSHEKNAGFFKTGKVFETFEAKLLHIESRPGRKSKNSGCDDLEFFMRCEVHISVTDIFINSLKRVADDGGKGKIRDLDKCNLLITKYDPDMDQDHPVSVYVYRRMTDVLIHPSLFHRGEPLPRVEYTPEEVMDIIPCEYVSDSGTLHCVLVCPKKTGFQLRSVAGLLSARDFLASLAFRVFQCTQYIRHASAPMHSPEPDCCHELLALSFLHHLLSFLRQLYWFTVGFVLCWKVWSAGLLSSYGELIYKPFNPEETAIQPYQPFQPVYFVSESFEDAKIKMRRYSSSIKRPFSVRYDPFTCSLEVLDQPSKIQHALGQMRDDLKILHSALEKLG